MKLYARNFVNAQEKTMQLKELEANAIDFISNCISDINFPSNPNLHTGRILGFNSIDADVNTINGTIEIYAEFSTLSGVKVNLVFPIPVIKGALISPSIVSINGAKKVFSQSAIETHIANLELNQPKLIRYPQPSMDYMHQQVVKPGIFTSPKDPLLFDYGTG
jgi:hypothetical protein